ncbi:MAG: hypothetical protein KG003_15690 [Bacteroidetes bacterium]|nr:hypothetical protein [Bacteroidota bacterium]
MKTQSKFFLILTVFCALLLPACTSKKATESAKLLKSYTLAQNAQDYHAACALLLQLVNQDSANNTWAYDSLAYYHYFQLVAPGTVRNTHTAIYYAQKGLDINPENTYLAEIKARLDLEDQKVTVAETSFRSLWNKTHDDTYLWILYFMEAHHKKNLAKADSLIDAAIANPQSETKTVRIDLLPDKIQEKIKSKAAFIYLKATVLIVQNKVLEASLALQEALKESPNFYAAKLAAYELQQSAKRQNN